MAGPARGVAGHREVADAAKQNRGSGFARLLKIKSGEKIMCRFRGYTRAISRGGMSWGTMLLGELRTLCDQWQVYPTVDGGDTMATLIERLIERQNQLEPATFTEHYIHANAAGRQYVTCAKVWGNLPCVACYLRDHGDKRISSKVSANFSVVPQRRYHYIKNEADPKKSEFVYCSAYGYQSTGRCTYCQRRIEAKQEGMKRFSIASMHANGVFACAERISKRCAACDGMGHIQHLQWACGECGEPLDVHDDPQHPFDASVEVRCGECKATGLPLEEVTCTKKCKAARRGQLFDTDILVERMGSDKKTTYSFTEQYPFTPAAEDILKFRLPTWEVALQPGSTDKQCHDIGVLTNPFTNAPVGPRGDAGESVPYDQPAGAGGYADPGEDIPY